MSKEVLGAQSLGFGLCIRYCYPLVSLTVHYTFPYGVKIDGNEVEYQQHNLTNTLPKLASKENIFL